MRKKKLTYAQVEFLCDQLAMILSSGMSISDGLELLCVESADKALVQVCADISEQTDNGVPLSEAMRTTGRFPDYAADMVKLGETNGKLEEVLRGLAEYYEDRDAIRRTLRSAVLHPMMLLLMMTVVIIVLVVAVIPMFGDIFSQFDSSVNETVQQTMSLAYNAGVIIMIVLLAIIAVSAVIAILSVFGKSGELMRRFAAAFPFTRGISQKLALADLTKAVSISVSAGVSPTEMMLHSNIRSFIRDKRLAAKYDDCEKRVMDGESFPDAIIESRLLPPLYARSLKLAYNSGCFESVWRKISDTYGEEASKSLMNVTAVIEPAIIVILGVLIGAILLMLMIPLMNIMSVLG
ncbi:MAG: type II secretion system F family protein [Oscillospiraceae bacterium]